MVSVVGLKVVFLVGSVLGGVLRSVTNTQCLKLSLVEASTKVMASFSRHW